jgi:hypothetical protein
MPEAALMDVAVSDSAESIFDTPARTRKLTKIERNNRVAIVIVWNDAISIQVEGAVADPPHLPKCGAREESRTPIA